jgi:hypothetical protein
MIDQIKEYASLINVALLIVVIGWLIHIARLSRTALIDKHDAQISEKEAQIKALQLEIDAAEKRHQSEKAVLEHTKSLFEKLATLPEDQAIEALKIEYQLRLEELDKREAAVLEAEAKSVIEEEKIELKQVFERVSSALDSGSDLVKYAQMVMRLLP